MFTATKNPGAARDKSGICEHFDAYQTPFNKLSAMYADGWSLLCDLAIDAASQDLKAHALHWSLSVCQQSHPWPSVAVIMLALVESADRNFDASTRLVGFTRLVRTDLGSREPRFGEARPKRCVASRERKFMKRRLLYLVVICIGLSGLLSAETKEIAAFEKLVALTGDWEGTVAWSGQPPKEIGAHYYTTGNGSAVVENLTNDMTSVYHLDGADLRMTHYCAAQNQPRLKATVFGPDNSGITFSFVDITNLSSPTAEHVNGLDVRFLAADHITLQFHFVSNGKEKDELVDLRRKK